MNEILSLLIMQNSQTAELLLFLETYSIKPTLTAVIATTLKSLPIIIFMQKCYLELSGFLRTRAVKLNSVVFTPTDKLSI